MDKWIDWRDGLLAYNASLWELDNEARRDRLRAHRDATPPGMGVRTGGSAPVKAIDIESLRESWRTFVGDIVTPELSIHRLLFCTFTFENYVSRYSGQEEVPGIQKGRKAIEHWMAITSEHTDSYVIVEERGKANSRLHYHGLVRVIRTATGNDLLLNTLRKAWSRGFSDVDEARSVSEACHYVTKYVLKGQYDTALGFWAKKSDRSHQIKLVA